MPSSQAISSASASAARRAAAASSHFFRASLGVGQRLLGGLGLSQVLTALVLNSLGLATSFLLALGLLAHGLRPRRFPLFGITQRSIGSRRFACEPVRPLPPL